MPSKFKARGWKIPDEIETDERICYCIEIPNKPEYRRAFVDNLWRLCRWFNWEHSKDFKARDVSIYFTQVLSDQFIEDFMCVKPVFRDNPDDTCQVQVSNDGGVTWENAWRKDNCVINPPKQRFADNSEIEYSYDGGTTYAPNPELDPRFNATTSPPPAGDDPDCIMAGNIRHAVSSVATEIYNGLNTGAAFFAIVGAVVAILATIVTVGAALPFAITLFSALLGLDAATFFAAIGSDQLDTFACLVYCEVKTNTGDNVHKFTVDNWRHIYDQISTTFSGIQIPFFQLFIVLSGSVGLQNAGAAGAGYGFDCSACECPECEERLGSFDNSDLTTQPYPVSGVEATYVVVTDANHYQAEQYSANLIYYIDLRMAVDNTRPIVSITASGGYARVGSVENGAGIYHDETTLLASTDFSESDGEQHPWTIHWTGSITTSELRFIGSASGDAPEPDGKGWSIGSIEVCYGVS